MLRTLAAMACLLVAPHVPALARAEPLRWTDFTWHAVIANGQRLERAALFVSAAIAGLPGTHSLQLDTGSHLNFLHGGAVADVDAAYARTLGRTTTVTGRIAGAPTTGEPFTVIPEYRAIFTRGEPTPVIGTLGTPFLERWVLIIDYPRQRLAVSDAAAPIPAEILEKATFSALDYRNGKIYVPVTLDGETRAEYFFDTGSSLFPLVTTREEWERLTRRRVNDPKNQRYTLPSWNDTWLDFVGAPMTGRLGIGPVLGKKPMVFFVNDAKFRIDQMPNTRGIIGNALLVRDYAIIIDLPSRRMGFIRSRDLRHDQQLHEGNAQYRPTSCGSARCGQRAAEFINQPLGCR